MIAWGTSVAFCFLVSAVYVVGLYVIPARVRKLPRDNTEHIYYRLGITTCSNILTVVLVEYCSASLARGTELENLTFAESMGFRVDNACMSIAVTVMLMLMFYAGPAVSFVSYLVLAAGRNTNINSATEPAAGSSAADAAAAASLLQKELPTSPTALWCNILRSQGRDMARHPEVAIRMLVFALLSEELIFRSVIILLMLATVPTGQHINSWRIALVCPFWFGVAHVHHAWTLWKDESSSGGASRGSKNSALIRSVITRTGFQLAYTTIFGVVAALLFMRTGNILAPIVSHVICNYAQLPNMSFMRGPNPSSHCATHSLSTGDLSCLYSYRYFMLALHAGGLVAFSLCLFPCTEALSQQSPLWSTTSS